MKSETISAPDGTTELPGPVFGCMADTNCRWPLSELSNWVKTTGTAGGLYLHDKAMISASSSRRIELGSPVEPLPRTTAQAVADFFLCCLRKPDSLSSCKMLAELAREERTFLWIFVWLRIQKLCDFGNVVRRTERGRDCGEISASSESGSVVETRTVSGERVRDEIRAIYMETSFWEFPIWLLNGNKAVPKSITNECAGCRNRWSFGQSIRVCVSIPRNLIRNTRNSRIFKCKIKLQIAGFFSL